MLFIAGDFFSRLMPAYSRDAREINNVFMQYLYFSAFMVLLIAGIIVVASIRFHHRRRPQEPKQVTGHNTLEILWTIFPLVVITYFFVVTIATMRHTDVPADDRQPPEVVIIGHQWWWEIRYPSLHIVTANELVLPVNKTLLARIESADVIHDWWVQELGPKIDAVPGRANFTRFHADKTGVYQGACSEYCGTQHAWMRMLVVVKDPDAFDTWVSQQQKIPPALPDSLLSPGALVFRQKTCSMCHTLGKVGSGPNIGPNLTHIASRQTLLSGMMPNTRENLTRFLQNPKKIKEGVLMPNFMLTPDELKHLVNYMEELK